MCNCGNRARPDVITSHQASADEEARRLADAEAGIAMMLASARNAVSNSGGMGWYEAPADPE